MRCRGRRPRPRPRRPTEPAAASANPPTASPSVSNTTPSGGATELPRTVLLAAPPGDKPDADTVAGRIRAVSRAGVGGVYSGSVVDVGTGKSLFNHRAGAAEIPASVNKLLTSAAVLSTARPRAPLHHLGGPVREEADHPGRRRRPVPGQQDDVVHLPGPGLGRRSGQEDRRRSEEGEAHLGHPGVRREPVHRSGLEPDLAERVRRPGHPDVGPVGRRGPARRRVPGTADERSGRAGRQGVRRRPPQAGHQGDRHRQGRRREGRPADRRRLFDAAGADRRAGADDQRQRRRRGAVPPGRGGRWPDRLDQSGPPADEADPHQAQGVARGHGRPGRQRTLPRQPGRRRHPVPAAPARGRGSRTRSSGA